MPSLAGMHGIVPRTRFARKDARVRPGDIAASTPRWKEISRSVETSGKILSGSREGPRRSGRNAPSRSRWSEMSQWAGSLVRYEPVLKGSVRVELRPPKASPPVASRDRVPAVSADLLVCRSSARTPLPVSPVLPIRDVHTSRATISGPLIPLERRRASGHSCVAASRADTLARPGRLCEVERRSGPIPSGACHFCPFAT